MPCRLCIDLDCLMILRTSLGAVAPEEGCALLLGELKPEITVRMVWPCCNVWHPGFAGLSESIAADGDQERFSPDRRSRFALDPREQIAAQRWSRQRGLRVLGSAHSHPGGQPVPSAVDRQWAAAEGVMVIDGGAAGVGAWWLYGPLGSHVRALSMVICGDSVLGDTVNSCPDERSLPLQ